MEMVIRRWFEEDARPRAQIHPRLPAGMRWTAVASPGARLVHSQLLYAPREHLELCL